MVAVFAGELAGIVEVFGWPMMQYGGSAGAPACNGGSSGVMALNIPELECFERPSASFGMLCRRGRLRSRQCVMRSRRSGSGCGSPRVSKGDPCSRAGFCIGTIPNASDRGLIKSTAEYLDRTAIGLISSGLREHYLQ